MFKGILMLMLDRLKSMRAKPMLWILFIAIVFLGVQCSKRVGGIHKPVVPIIYSGTQLIVPEQSPLRSVITIKAVQSHSVVSTLTLPAVVQEMPSNNVDIFMPFPGQIDTYYKKLGESVRKGDPLFAIISPDMTQAITDKINAEASDILAKQTLKRQQKLSQLNIGPKHDLQLAESVFIQAEAELRRTIARLNALHIPESDMDASGKLIIRSPIDGTVTAVHSGPGSYWSDLTSPIMNVVNISQVYAMASVQERDVPSVFLGQPVDVLVENDTHIYHGTVSVINPILNADTRTLSVGVILDNIDQRLKPNMFVRSRFKSNPRAQIILPLTAVIQRGFDSIVFVEISPWTFVPRLVQVGAQTGDTIEIQSGLAEKERVALTGGIILND